MIRVVSSTRAVLSPYFSTLTVLTCLGFPISSLAIDVRIGDQETLKHDQRQAELEASLSSSSPDLRAQLPEYSGDIRFPQESPCFAINSVALNGADNLPAIGEATELMQSAVGQCLGSGGLKLLMDRLQNMWVSQGLVTTRVLAPAQNLSSGKLTLQVIQGVVSDVRFADQSHARSLIDWGMPVETGDLLNLRDIEQGLENLQAIPSVKADFKLMPGELPGESEILINYDSQRPWRALLSLNDSGSDTTGKYQGGATLYWDNPLDRNDAFYIALGNDLHGDAGKQSNNITLNYRIPYQYWKFDLTLNNYEYLQTVQGLNEVIDYEGENQSLQLNIERNLFRNNRTKASVFAGLSLRESKNFIEGQEVQVQRRKSTRASVGVQFTHYLSWATLDGSLSFHKGLKTFGALPAPESSYSNVDTLTDIYKIRLGLTAPVTLGSQRLNWRTSLVGQWSGDPLTTTDQISIGSRYSVRGFDGKVTLSGESGFYLQNELSIPLPSIQAQAFIGIDLGAVSGPATEGLAGDHLIGGVIGLNGVWKGINYRVFVGTPIKEPRPGFSDSTTMGFDISWRY